LITARRRRGGVITVGAILTAGALVLTGCSAGGAASGGSGDFSFMSLTDNNTTGGTIKALSTTTCSAANKTAALKSDSIAQSQLDQKLQLLAAQNALPSMFIAPGTPSLARQFIKSNKLVDVSKELDKSGQADEILPAAASTLKKLYGLITIDSPMCCQGRGWASCRRWRDGGRAVWRGSASGSGGFPCWCGLGLCVVRRRRGSWGPCGCA